MAHATATLGYSLRAARGCPRFRQDLRQSLGAPGCAEVMAAVRVLRKLAACKESGGTLRPRYLEMAELLEAEADAIGQVTSRRSGR